MLVISSIRIVVISISSEIPLERLTLLEWSNWLFLKFSFPSESHEWLLSDAVDILPHLLLPLAGPEEFPEDDMEKLPPDLQYLGDDKQREADPDIRKMLLEALLQVGKKPGGRYFRSVQCVAGTL